MKSLNHFISVVSAVILISSPVFADSYLTLSNNGVKANASDYWTPERLKNAKPMVPPQRATAISESAATTGQTGASAASPGKGPAVKVTPNLSPLFTPNQSSSGDSEIEPQAVGTSGAYYTSSRLIPLSADLAYPYRSVGKLFFSTPGGDSVCSASVLRSRIVLTAGHCVHSGSGGASGFFSNWLFVPAFRNGAAPFQAWNWQFVSVTNTWATGGGAVPNAADYAMFEVEDRIFNGVFRRIGDVTGFLGFRTQALLPNHAHLLGYPANFDSGNIMHQVTSQSFASGGSNTVVYGSDSRGGSSGGPWVENFGARAAGQTGGFNLGLNQVISVTSYGPTSFNPKTQGASILDGRFTTILNNLCARRSGNC